MDFVEVWKALSIVLTGASGILGLLKDFKDEDGKITRWGRVSLGGIILFTTLALVAQLKQTSNQEQSRRATANQTLQLAQKTDQAVRDIQRSLIPLGEPQFTIFFRGECTDSKYITLCRNTDEEKKLDQNALSEWPNLTEQMIYLDFFRDPIAAKTFIEGGGNQPDLKLYLIATVSEGTFRISHTSQEVFLEVKNCLPSSERYNGRPYSNGEIISALDLPGTTVVITTTRHQALSLNFANVRGFSIRLKNGQIFGLAATEPNAKSVNVDETVSMSGHDEPGFQFVLSGPGN